MELAKLNEIEEAISIDFEEYTVDNGYSPSEAIAKILEEEWRQVNQNTISQVVYILMLSNECFKAKQIPDFLYNRLVELLEKNKFISYDNITPYADNCKKLLAKKDYEIIKSNLNAKSRINYIFSLTP